MYLKSIQKHSLICACTIVALTSCGHSGGDDQIPEIYKRYITKAVTPLSYKQLPQETWTAREDVPDSLTSSEILEDIEILEYLWTTSYSGYEYWSAEGVDFDIYIDRLKDWADSSSRFKTQSFEARAVSILDKIYDGHISFVGEGYYAAYRHRAAYFTDILVEKSTTGDYLVIDSKCDKVEVGTVFTHEDKTDHLFKTLAPPGKQHFLIGLFTYDPPSSIQLSFENEVVDIPLRKSRLLLAKFDDTNPYYIDSINGSPLVRVTSFGDVLYPQMQDFMRSGTELNKEERVIINLFNNGGGSSIYPQTFLKNLNGSVQWDVHWAELTSPAIAEYYARYELDESTTPGTRRLVSRYTAKFEKLKSFPAKSWTFYRDEKKDIEGSFKGQLILMTNRRVLSAGENLVGASASVRNRIVIGENTGGVAQFSSACAYTLPNSRMILNLPRQLIFIPGLEECVGFLPDYWLDTHKPLEEVINWLDSPDEYQFRYSQSYEELIGSLRSTAIPPADTKVSFPEEGVPDSWAQFSGRWFGVSDGVLDHLLIVESISIDGEVSAIYAWGVAHQWGVSPGWERFKGSFQGEKLVLSAPDRNLTITYKVRSDKTMDSWYKRPGINSYTEMVKIVED